MLIKEAVHESCGECGRSKRQISEQVYGCDTCKKPIDFPGKGGKRHHDYLRVSIFRSPAESRTEHMEFCSWKCVVKKLATIKCDYFISLPYLQYERDTVKGQHARDFFKLLKKA